MLQSNSETFMKLTDNYKKHFSYNPLQRILMRHFYKTILELIQNLPITSVLDVGCGEGFALNILKKNNLAKTFVGLEQSQEAIDLGKKLHPFINFNQGDIYKMGYKKAQFDLVICTEVLEHLSQPKIALKKIVRVSKRYCLLSVPNEPWFMLANFLRGKNLSLWGNDPGHIQHWSKKQFINLITSQHLKPKATKAPFPWTMILAENN